MRRFQHSLTPVTSISGPGDSLVNTDHDVEDGEMIFVRSTRQVFQYANPSAAVVDGVTVVQPNFGAGKWLLMTGGGAGGSSFAEFYNTASAGALGSGRVLDTTLAVLGALTDGDKVWVRSVKDSYTWYATSVAVADGVVVVNPTANGVNPGRFIRDNAGSPLWAAQANWVVSPTHPSASDENDGLTGAAPLRTWAELRRRMPTGSTAGCAISIGSNLPSTDPMITFAGIATITGLLTATAGGTTAAYTARSPSTAVLAQLQEVPVGGPPVPHFTGSDDALHLVRMSAGAALNCVAFVQSVTGGGFAANLSSFISAAGVEQVAAPGDGFTIYTPPTVAEAHIDASLLGGGLTISLLVMPSAPTFALHGTPSDGALVFFACSFRSAITVDGSVATFHGCRFNGVTARNSRTTFNGGYNTFVATVIGGNVAMNLGLLHYGQVTVQDGAYSNYSDVFSNVSTGPAFLHTAGARGLADTLWGLASGAPGGSRYGCQIGVTAQLEVTAANRCYIGGTDGFLKVGTVAAGAWPAVGGLTPDPASLAAIYHD